VGRRFIAARLPARLTLMSRYLPKSIVCLPERYTLHGLLADVLAGVTVGVIALPLAMAFGIASIPEQVARDAGISPPAVGLFTAGVAGFLISALGGIRVQIGGPTGAFIVIVYHIALTHGYAGLVTATLMAGAIIVVPGPCRIGAIIKFIPYPVTTGFTSGIAVIIFSTGRSDDRRGSGGGAGVAPLYQADVRSIEHFRHSPGIRERRRRVGGAQGSQRHRQPRRAAGRERPLFSRACTPSRLWPSPSPA
jgi:MFS superfamily sulfate permease-like transporter